MVHYKDEQDKFINGKDEGKLPCLFIYFFQRLLSCLFSNTSDQVQTNGRRGGGPVPPWFCQKSFSRVMRAELQALTEGV
jgi:hypothetical protein